MKAELITIGDEILIGQIINTNAAFLSKTLNEIGITIVRVSSVSDDRSAITSLLDEFQDRADIAIVTGGLGPTNDDLTKHTLCQYFGDRLVWYPEILAHIEELFEKYVSTPINKKNREQALLPEKAKIFKNRYGTASGMWFEQNGKIVIALPGVPYEMESLMTLSVIPELQQRYSFPFIYHKTVLTYGLGESVIAARIEQWENNLPDTVKLAYLPSLGRVRLRLSATGFQAHEVMQAVDQQVERLRPMIEDIYVGIEEKGSIEQMIASRLTELGKSLALAESCTGGKLASVFTALPGASAYFKGSAVTYSGASKTAILGVPQTLIQAEGVVSAAVAEAMALKAKNAYQADYTLSTTGNAGPTQGDPKAPLGVVYIALAHPEGVESYQFQLGNHRHKVIQKAVNKALEILYKALTISS